MPRGPVTESEVGVFWNEVDDGWNLIGAFPMLDVCLCVIVEEVKERMARGNCPRRAEMRGIMVWGELITRPGYSQLPFLTWRQCCMLYGIGANDVST